MSRARAAILVAFVAATIAAIVALRGCDAGTQPARPAASTAPTTDARPAAAPTPRPRRAHADDAKPADESPKPDTTTTPTPEQPAAPAPDGPTGVAIDVADESGAPVRGATVRLFVADSNHWTSPGIKSVVELSKNAHHPEAGETITLDVAKEADGIPVQVYGSADGFPPFAPVVFTIHAGKVEHVRLIATKPRSATVIVVDAATDRPIAGARVVSVTEGDRRHWIDRERPAPSVADADGRCVVEGLSGGDHDVEVNADRYHQSEAKWTGTDLRVRLEPQTGGAKVVVKVLGPGGIAMPGIAVSLVGTDRVVKSDAAGVAVFDDVAPGFAIVSIGMFEWRDAVVAAKLPDMAPRHTAETDIESGGTYELVLGAPPAGTGTIDGRLLREDGSPLPGVSVTVSTIEDRKSAETDSAGNARFSELLKGTYGAHASFGRNIWFFDHVALADGAHLNATWTLGSATIRGRVVGGADHHGVEGVTVWFRGVNTGAAHSGKDGGFELPNAPVGTYSVDAKTETAFAAPRDVVVPATADVVVELVDFGRVAVRFLAADRAALRAAEFSLVAAGTDKFAALLKPGAGDDDLVAATVGPGRYEVMVTLGDRKQRFPVAVKSGATSVVEVRVP